MLTITASTGVAVDLTRRTISGTLVRAGEVGLTSAGPLTVNDLAGIALPPDLTTVPLTREHEDHERGYLVSASVTPERIYVTHKVADGPEGDAALQEAMPRVPDGAIRGGLSFVLADPVVQDGAIVSGRLVAIGQVKTPAYNSSRVDRIAASRHTEGHTMTPEQIARLAELRALTTLTQEQATELATLAALETPAEPTEPAAPAAPAAAAPAPAPAAPATAPVAASLPAVPGGAGGGTQQLVRASAVSPLDAFCQQIADAMARNKMHGETAMKDAVNQVITAAMADITQTGVAAVERKQWIGELWDGLDYQPMFLPLLGSDGMENFSGIGWHWTTKPVATDYAGDKAAVTSAAIAVAADNWTAARVFVGHDIDRKFFDFPGEDNAAFIKSYLAASAEAIVKLLDQKALAYILAGGNSTAIVGAAGLGVLKAAATGKVALTNAWMGQAEWVLVNDQDYLNLLDTTASNVPAFLDLIGVTPDKMIPTSSVTTKNVFVGVRNAATFRTPKGQPFRVEVQNVPNGGIDLASFAYWATEKHTALGIQKVSWT